MKVTYKDENGTYSITVHKDKTATMKHMYNGVLYAKKSYTSYENAQRALYRYCGGMPQVTTVNAYISGNNNKGRNKNEKKIKIKQTL